MPTRAFVLGVAFVASLLGLARNALAATPEPWSDSDPPAPPTHLTWGDFGFRGGAEYRANMLYIDPLALASETENKELIIEHRLRLNATIDWQDKVKIVTSVDVLDGVLWGDNGTFGTDPEPNSANVDTNNSNAGTLCIKQTVTGGNPADPNSYGYGVCPANYFFVRHLYGDIVTPVGLFRIGRQPFTEGNSTAVSDGDGRRNRFGTADKGNSADRILFATKPLEAFKSPDLRDKSEDRGLFLIGAYDQLVIDDPMRLGGDVQEWITALRYLDDHVGPLRTVEARLFHTYRWEPQFDTAVNAIGGRFSARWGNIYAGIDGTGILGHTREISEAFAVVTNDPPASQAIQQLGMRAVVRYDRPKWGAYLEADYASGDSDPRVSSPLTQFRFAEDSNVGLLMFKHVLAYQSGRAAAAASYVLQSLNAPTIPVEAIDTRGAFTDAFALFPQFDLRPFENFLMRGGVLLAWAPAPLLDPIQSQERQPDGRLHNINFAGGTPGTNYGTELDGRIQYRLYEHFIADLEGAILFPGNVFRDQDGYAARSTMLQLRTTFFF